MQVSKSSVILLILANADLWYLTGSGSILAALRVGVPLIVVPNDGLLHGHQLELALELARQGYVIHGKLEYVPEASGRVTTDKAAEIFPQLSRTLKNSEHGCNSGLQSTG